VRDLEQRQNREVLREIGPGAVEDHVREVGDWRSISVAGYAKAQRVGTCKMSRRAEAAGRGGW
jgi:hypothetical protein